MNIPRMKSREIGMARGGNCNLDLGKLKVGCCCLRLQQYVRLGRSVGPMSGSSTTSSRQLLHGRRARHLYAVASICWRAE